MAVEAATRTARDAWHVCVYVHVYAYVCMCVCMYEVGSRRSATKMWLANSSLAVTYACVCMYARVYV